MSAQQRVVKFLRRVPAPLVRLLAGKPLQIDGFRLDPNLQLLANAAAKQQRPFEDLEQYRRVTSRAFKMLNGPRRPGVAVTDGSIAGPRSELAIRSYQPAGVADPTPAVVFFHQGGLVLLDLDTCDTFCTILADECQARVISLDYRRCPDHPFPAPLEDARALWDHVQENAASQGIDPHRVAVAGDSAGGLLAAVLCQQLKAAGGIQPAAQLLVYPWVATDIEPTGSLISCADTFPLSREVIEYFNGLVFRDGVSRADPRANPLLHPDLSGLPPAVVATAGFDPIRDQGDQYASRLREMGVPVTHRCFGSLCHGFLAMGLASKRAEQAGVDLARLLADQL